MRTAPASGVPGVSSTGTGCGTRIRSPPSAKSAGQQGAGRRRWRTRGWWSRTSCAGNVRADRGTRRSRPAPAPGRRRTSRSPSARRQVGWASSTRTGSRARASSASSVASSRSSSDELRGARRAGRAQQRSHGGREPGERLLVDRLAGQQSAARLGQLVGRPCERRHQLAERQGQARDERRYVAPLRLLGRPRRCRRRPAEAVGAQRVDHDRVEAGRPDHVGRRAGGRTADPDHPAVLQGDDERQLGGDRHPCHPVLVVELDAEDLGRRVGAAARRCRRRASSHRAVAQREQTEGEARAPARRAGPRSRRWSSRSQSRARRQGLADAAGPSTRPGRRPTRSGPHQDRWTPVAPEETCGTPCASTVLRHLQVAQQVARSRGEVASQRLRPVSTPRRAGTRHVAARARVGDSENPGLLLEPGDPIVSEGGVGRCFVGSIPPWREPAGVSARLPRSVTMTARTDRGAASRPHPGAGRRCRTGRRRGGPAGPRAGSDSRGTAARRAGSGTGGGDPDGADGTPAWVWWLLAAIVLAAVAGTITAVVPRAASTGGARSWPLPRATSPGSLASCSRTCGVRPPGTRSWADGTSGRHAWGLRRIG